MRCASLTFLSLGQPEWRVLTTLLLFLRGCSHLQRPGADAPEAAAALLPGAAAWEIARGSASGELVGRQQKRGLAFVPRLKRVLLLKGFFKGSNPGGRRLWVGIHPT